MQDFLDAAHRLLQMLPRAKLRHTADALHTSGEQDNLTLPA